MPTTAQAPAVRRASASQQRYPAADQQALGYRRPPEEYDDDWPPRTPMSAVRYAPAALPAPQRRSRLLYFAIPIFCICLGAYLAVIIPPAIQQWRDNNAYGFPRTF